MWNLKIHQASEYKKKKQTHRCRKWTSGYKWGAGREEEQDKGWGLRGTNYYV